MKKFLLALLVSATLFMTGCRALDSLLLDPMVDIETGEQLYVDLEATEALPESAKENGEVVVVLESERVPGREYELAYSGDESATVKSAKGLISTLGPWGALGGGLLSLLTGGYAAARGRKKFKLGGTKELLTSELVKMIEELKANDGDLNETVKKLGSKVKDPEYLKEVVRIVTGDFSDSERQKLLEKAAADAVKRNG
jgi:hypothetical protein